MGGRDGAAGQVPDLHLPGEALVGGDVGVGLAEGGNPHVGAVRRRAQLQEAVGLAQGAHGAGFRVHQGGLGGAVVVEQVLVVGVAQGVAVLVGAALALAAEGFLDAGAGGDRGRGRGRPLARGHQLDQQALLVGHPLEFAAEHGVQADTGHAAHGAGGAVAHPQLHGVRGHVLEREALPVGAPHGPARAAALGQVHVDGGAVGNAQEVVALGRGGDAVAPGRVVPAVVLRLDADARQAQEGRGHAPDGGVGLPGHQEHAVPGGVEEGDGRGGRPHDVQDGLGRLAVALGRGLGEPREGKGGAQQGCPAGDLEPSW